MGKDRVGRCCPERDRPPGRAAGGSSLPSVEVPTRPNAPGIGAARARMAMSRSVFLTSGGFWGPLIAGARLQSGPAGAASTGGHPAFGPGSVRIFGPGPGITCSSDGAAAGDEVIDDQDDDRPDHRVARGLMARVGFEAAPP